MPIWRMSIACWIPKATNTHIHTHRLCSSYCFPTATMVARTHLSLTLYVHWLSCFYCLVLITFSPTFFTSKRQSQCWKYKMPDKIELNWIVIIIIIMIGSSSSSSSNTVVVVKMPVEIQWRNVTFQYVMHTSYVFTVNIVSNQCTSSYNTRDVRKILHVSALRCHPAGWLLYRCCNNSLRLAPQCRNM
jgi:hypothetical protein